MLWRWPIVLLGMGLASEVYAGEADGEAPAWNCARGLGLALGANRGTGSWQEVGGNGWTETSSILFVAQCEPNKSLEMGTLAVGVDFAPFFVQPRRDGTWMRQFAVGHATLWMGHAGFRMGPQVRAGYTALGAGIAGAWQGPPHGNGVRAGIEGRVVAHYVGKIGLQGSVVVTMRRNVRHRGAPR